MNNREKEENPEKENNEAISQSIEEHIADVGQVTINTTHEFEDNEKNEKNEEKLIITSVLESAMNEAVPYINYTYNATSIYFFWILMHYFSAQLYVYYCAPSGIYGLIISPFLISAPHCRALRWIIHSGGNMVDNMWIILGTWLCSKMLLNK